ncbi:MAG: tRNA dihydrouridine synthase DusB [Clostridia bacterium]
MEKGFYIGNVYIKNKYILAPMAGISDVGLRFLASYYGAGLTCTEMVSAKAILHDSKKTKYLLNTTENEKPVAVQIFGNEPEVMAQSILSGAFDKFDIIDINMGCPANKIVSNKEGSALMKNLPLASKIIKACVAATNKPITVKFRAGYDDNSRNAVEFAHMCEDSGASAITIHGRTKEQGYAGKSDPLIIRDVKNAVKIPVIANGDVVDKDSAENLLKITGADAVMIGRGAYGNPEIFAKLLGNDVKETKKEIILKHIEILNKYFDDKYVNLVMRGHLLAYLKGEKNSSNLKQLLLKTESTAEIVSLITINL